MAFFIHSLILWQPKPPPGQPWGFELAMQCVLGFGKDVEHTVIAEAGVPVMWLASVFHFDPCSYSFMHCVLNKLSKSTACKDMVYFFDRS
jgi:hypothetical protein